MRRALSLADFVLVLINQTHEEVRELAKILEAEYGIEADEASVLEAGYIKIKRKNKPRIFVPRTIGQPQKGVSSIRIRKARTFL